MVIVWFLAGSALGMVLVELAATLFYCLPKAALRVARHTNRVGLVFLFLRAALLRAIVVVILFVAFSIWGVSHHRALASGLSLVLAAYALYALGGRVERG